MKIFLFTCNGSFSSWDTPISESAPEVLLKFSRVSRSSSQCEPPPNSPHSPQNRRQPLAKFAINESVHHEGWREPGCSSASSEHEASTSLLPAGQAAGRVEASAADRGFPAEEEEASEWECRADQSVCEASQNAVESVQQVQQLLSVRLHRSSLCIAKDRRCQDGQQQAARQQRLAGQQDRRQQPEQQPERRQQPEDQQDQQPDEHQQPEQADRPSGASR